MLSKDAVQISLPYVAVREDVNLRVLQHSHKVLGDVLVLGLPFLSFITGFDCQVLLLDGLCFKEFVSSRKVITSLNIVWRVASSSGVIIVCLTF